VSSAPTVELTYRLLVCDCRHCSTPSLSKFIGEKMCVYFNSTQLIAMLPPLTCMYNVGCKSVAHCTRKLKKSLLHVQVFDRKSGCSPFDHPPFYDETPRRYPVSFVAVPLLLGSRIRNGRITMTVLGPLVWLQLRPGATPGVPTVCSYAVGMWNSS